MSGVVGRNIRNLVDVFSLGCFIISPLPNFVMRSHFSDWILDADFEFNIIFDYDVIMTLHAAVMCVLLYFENYLR